eukprot:TRINITY_DN14780_c0_g1_i6.p1 TRINITY_DN14780_c0_g1~~TRINITY_DN14780_c0_g1_i6.p1  ORF type:complete len:432 (-),score=83.52 TRINITY_DN14780_c0_g1_i6:247-1542(-)
MCMVDSTCQAEIFRSVDESLLDSEAKHIIEQYVGPGAPYEINLPIHMVKELRTCLKLQKFHKAMFSPAQMEALSLCSAHWQRYPSSVYYEKWLAAKLSDPTSLGLEPATSQPSPSPTSPNSTSTGATSNTTSTTSNQAVPPFQSGFGSRSSLSGNTSTPGTPGTPGGSVRQIASVIPSRALPPEDLRARIESQMKIKTFENFMGDPSGFRAFKSFLEESKLSMEYLEYMLFWVDIERYKDTPTPEYAKELFQKYLVADDPDELGLIQLPQAIYEGLKNGLDSSNQHLFNSAQAQVMNRLKKVAFNRAFFASQHFEKYVDEVVMLETVFLEDIHNNDSQKLKAIFLLGKPGFNGLDVAALCVVLGTLLHLRYNIEMSKEQVAKYASSVAKAVGLTSKFVHFSDFQNLCYCLIHDPQVPPHHIDLTVSSSENK